MKSTGALNSGQRAIVLLGHGSRDPQWRQTIEAVAATISKRDAAFIVRCAYLELCTPSLPDVFSELIAQGIGNFRVFPFFLGVGKHTQEDLPQLIAQLGITHPEIAIELLPTAGEYEPLISLLADIALS